MDQWYYSKQGQRLGPISREDLQRLAGTGELAAADLVWKQGMAAWGQAGAVEGLTFGAAPAGGPPAVPASLDYAGFGIRAAARIVDTIACFVFGLVAGAFCGVLFAVLQASGRLVPGWIEALRKPSLLGFLCSLGAMVAYHSLCEGLYGASVGKLICGLRVVSEDGGPSRLGGAVVRNLAYLLDAMFFGLVAYSRMSKSPMLQRYGDAWGGTAVVAAASVPPSSRRTGVELLFALFLASAAAVVLDALGAAIRVFL